MDKFVVIDVGAAGGLHQRWKSYQDQCEVIGFEPDIRSTEKFSPVGLYKESGTLPFYETRTKTDSSLFLPNHQFLNKFPKADRFKVERISEIEVKTLDSLLTKEADFIKLDTQGSELAILQGAEKTLEDALGVEVEVEFSALYQGQPLFAEVDMFLRKKDFQLFDLASVYWKRKLGKGVGNSKGQIIYADALYFKNAEKIKKIDKAIFMAKVYGYMDFAFELGETEVPKKESSFPGKRSIGKILRRIAQRIDPDPNVWNFVGSHLGNRHV